MGTITTVKTNNQQFKGFSNLEDRNYFLYQDELYLKLEPLKGVDNGNYNALCINDSLLSKFNDHDEIIEVSKVDISYRI